MDKYIYYGIAPGLERLLWGGDLESGLAVRRRQETLIDSFGVKNCTALDGNKKKKKKKLASRKVIRIGRRA